MENRTCTKCFLTKPLSEYYKNPTGKAGYMASCRVCTRADAKARKDRDPEAYSRKVAERRARTSTHRDTERNRAAANRLRTDAQIEQDRNRLRLDGTKTCRKCHVSRPFQYFDVKRGIADGLNTDCKLCRKLERSRLNKIASFDTRGLSVCVYCGGAFEHIDHIFPVSLGGKDIQSNLVPSCRLCNQRKSGKHPLIWLEAVFPGQDHYAQMASWGIDWSHWKAA